MRRVNSPAERYNLEHDDIFHMMTQIPGQDVMRSILRSLLSKNGKYIGPSRVFYSSNAEFGLGRCGPHKKNSRIDLMVEVRTSKMYAENRPGMVIALEVKTTDGDLLRERDNLRDKYIKSDQADSYWLLASTDDIALKACCKYSDMPQVGVACMSSARVLKVPERVGMSDRGRLRYVNEMNRRSMSSINDRFHEYHIRDNHWVELIV